MTNEASTFPTAVDVFQSHFEILASDIPNIQRYQTLVLKTNRTPSEEDELTNLKVTLQEKIFTASDLNKIQNCMVALEDFFLNHTVAYLNTLDVGQLRTDLGFPANLTTTDKSSAISGINEVKAEANTNATNLSNHTSNTSNPHNTTASQVGAYSKSESDGKYALNSYLWRSSTVGIGYGTSNGLQQLAINSAGVGMQNGITLSGDNIMVNTAGIYLVDVEADISGLGSGQTYELFIRAYKDGVTYGDYAHLIRGNGASAGLNQDTIWGRNMGVIQMQQNGYLQILVRLTESPRTINDFRVSVRKISN